MEQRNAQVFKDLNEIRTEPSSFTKRLEVFKTALSRFKGTSTNDMIKDIDNFNKQLLQMKGTSELTFHKGLQKAAEIQLDEYEEKKKFTTEFILNDLEKRANKFVNGYLQIFQLADEGADTGADVLNKMLLNKLDKEKRNRRNILDPNMNYAGVATRLINKQHVTVIVMADKVVDRKNKKLKRPRNDNDDLSELKQAFDWFDVNKVGIINPAEIAAAMKSLGYDTKNTTMFDLIKELDNEDIQQDGGIDFETFADHIMFRLDDVYTDEGLSRVFNMFIDDPNQQTITLHTLKRICRELGETFSADQLKDMLERASVGSTELTFDEFKAFMATKYPIQDKPKYLDEEHNDE